MVLNSIAGRKINLRRSVRQGDPLSPYIFILAMDFLTTWIRKLVQLRVIHPPFAGYQSCLLYADDTLLILQPTAQQMRIIKIILDIFEKLFGLCVNLEKSDLLLTASELQMTAQLASILRCKASSFSLTYLGLPLSNQRLKKSDYLPLIHKIKGKLLGWKASTLSIGGRVVLLNATLIAIPVYYMSTFVLPKWVILRLDKLRRKFFWQGHKRDGKVNGFTALTR